MAVRRYNAVWDAVKIKQKYRYGPSPAGPSTVPVQMWAGVSPVAGNGEVYLSITC